MSIFSQVKDSVSSVVRASISQSEGLWRAQRAYFSVAPTPVEVVSYRGRARLLRYASTMAQAKPLLIIPSLIGRYYLFDLLPQKSFVSFFSQRGFDVYLIDWSTPTPADRDITFGQHIEEYLSHFAAEVCRRTKTKDLSLVGYSLGGVMAASFAALSPDKIASLVLLSTPIDLSLSGNVGRSIRAGHRGIDVMLSAFGEMPAWAIQGGFQWLTPGSFWGDAARVMLTGDSSSKEELAAMQRWLHDSVAIPKAAYREIVHTLYLQNALLQDRFMVGGRPVLLQNIQCPALVVTADDDHICPPVSSLALRNKSSIEHMMIPGAHTAAALGAAKTLWPQLASWMSERAQ